MGYLATILLILLLISINAFFAASEIALISTRRVKLKLMKEDSQELEAIQHLLERPNEFLATIQICITLAGFFASATGAVSLSRELGRKLESTSLPILGTLGEELAGIFVTFVIKPSLHDRTTNYDKDTLLRGGRVVRYRKNAVECSKRSRCHSLCALFTFSSRRGSVA